MQCPKEIDIQKGFRLTDDVYIPYCDHRHIDPKLKLTEIGERMSLDLTPQLVGKIKPCVIGFRRLADGNSYVSLRNGWENYRKGAYQKANRKTMCYFGNALGPQPKPDSPFDVDSEEGILNHYPSLNHPNEKRGQIARIMQSLGAQYDARLINSGNLETTHKSIPN